MPHESAKAFLRVAGGLGIDAKAESGPEEKHRFAVRVELKHPNLGYQDVREVALALAQRFAREGVRVEPEREDTLRERLRLFFVRTPWT